jgi:hypothetical protein
MTENSFHRGWRALPAEDPNKNTSEMIIYGSGHAGRSTIFLNGKYVAHVTVFEVKLACAGSWLASLQGWLPLSS